VDFQIAIRGAAGKNLGGFIEIYLSNYRYLVAGGAGATTQTKQKRNHQHL